MPFVANNHVIGLGHLSVIRIGFVLKSNGKFCVTYGVPIYINSSNKQWALRLKSMDGN